MSLQSVRQFFAERAPDIEIIELTQSTATVALAAAAHNVEPGQIAKTLSLKIKERVVLVVAKGDARLDNKKLKEAFGAKARMLSSDEVITLTGHPIGGVCPFGVKDGVKIYLDVSMQRFTTVFPACGEHNNAIELTPADMEKYTPNQGWIDVCKGWQAQA